MGATSESIKKAVKKYNAKNVKKYLLQLNINTDEDVIRRLESVSNKNGYLKALIREDIQKS